MIDWLKYKHFKVMDTVILVYSENPFSILVGTMINKKIKALANVEFGFKPEEKAFRQINQTYCYKGRARARYDLVGTEIAL
ncbi:hypothetical protein [Lysinibacillus sp. NPDC086135]|uniref:hypothetical protein n=1 Tax=Lysinibacillus sp. NPDC086135 TaxID=3364130 RepID=UPI0037F627DB